MTESEENTPQSGPQRLPEGDDPRSVFITADQFRLADVIAHMKAGKLVIVVPADPPADPNPPAPDSEPA